MYRPNPPIGLVVVFLRPVEEVPKDAHGRLLGSAFTYTEAHPDDWFEVEHESGIVTVRRSDVCSRLGLRRAQRDDADGTIRE